MPFFQTPRLQTRFYSQRTACNYWDSFNPRDLRRGPIRLFNENHTRHEHAGRQHDEPVGECEQLWLRQWRARSNVPATGSVSHAMHAWASITTVMFGMGNMPRVFAPLSDLLSEHAVDMSLSVDEVVVPPRQNYFVAIETDQRALSALLEVLPTNVAPESLVWIHLYGIKSLRVDTDSKPDER